MRLFFNSRGDIDCCGLTGDSSVTELAEACLDFCGRHIDCSRCRHSCCGGLAVYPDHIFFARLEQMTRPDAALSMKPDRLSAACISAEASRLPSAVPRSGFIPLTRQRCGRSWPGGCRHAKQPLSGWAIPYALTAAIPPGSEPYGTGPVQ